MQYINIYFELNSQDYNHMWTPNKNAIWKVSQCAFLWSKSGRGSRTLQELHTTCFWFLLWFFSLSSLWFIHCNRHWSTLSELRSYLWKKLIWKIQFVMWNTEEGVMYLTFISVLFNRTQCFRELSRAVPTFSTWTSPPHLWQTELSGNYPGKFEQLKTCGRRRRDQVLSLPETPVL